MTFPLRMQRRFVRGHGVRLALTVIALALGVALVAAMDIVNRAVLFAFVEVIDTMAGRAALQVGAGGGALFPEETAALVEAVAGVELAVPVVATTAFTSDQSGEVLTVHGFELTRDEAVRVYEADDGALELEDELVFLNQPDSIAVTRAFAARRGLGLGDALTLDTVHGRRAFTVRGLLEPKGIARLYGGNLVLLDLYAAEAAFAAPGLVNRLDVVVARDADVEAVAERMRAVLPAGLTVAAPQQRKADLHRVMQSLHAVLQGMALVGLIAAFLISFNRLTTVFDARAWQLGVLRAVGLRDRAIWRELVKESLLLGLAGIALGLPLGVLLGKLLLPAIATTTAMAHQMATPAADLRVRPASLALAAGLGLVAVVLAALLPAWRATQTTIIETIRSRGREQEGTRQRLLYLVFALIAAAIPAAVWAQSATRSGTWGVVATVLITVATAMAARPLIALLDSPSLPALSRLAGPTGRFARDAVSQHPRRASLTAAMLGVGLGAVLWLWMLGGSFERSVVDFLRQAVSSDLVISSARTEGFREAPLDGRIVEEIAAVPGIAGVAAQRSLDWTYAGGPIAINTFDRGWRSDPRYGTTRFYDQRAGAREDFVEGRAAWVSSSFRHNLGLGVGDTITLEAPAGTVSLPIAAVMQDFDSPRGVVLMARDLYRRHWYDDAITRVYALVAPGADAGAVRAEITRRLGATYGLRVGSAADLRDYFAHQVRQAFFAVDLLAGGVLFVVLVGIADTLAAGVLDRVRLFGAMRAIGARSTHVHRLVIAESLMLGGLGLALAMASGFALGALWVRSTFTHLLGWVLDLYFPLRQVGALGLVTIAVCVLAALLPARRAARIEVGEALRYE